MKTLNIHNPFSALLKQGAPVFHAETVTSTMDVSKKLAGEGLPHGTVICADFQEAGRGRGSARQWQMEKMMSLPFTILLRYGQLENIPAALTLRCGLAVSLALEDIFSLYKKADANAAPVKVFVKWPNDIIIDSKKAGGILCESDGGNVYAGIGVNILQKRFPPRLSENATSIALVIDNEQLTINNEKNARDFRFTLLEMILIHLYNEIEISTDDSWRLRVEQRLYKKGAPVVFISGAADSGREVKGVIYGIGEGGELLIIPDGKTAPCPFITGELKIF